jgi:hypothetical protein
MGAYQDVGELLWPTRMPRDTIPIMSIDWSTTKKWPHAAEVTKILSTLEKLRNHPAELSAHALPEMLTVAKIHSDAIADVFEAVHKIVRYNEAANEQFAKQVEAVCTLIKAVKAQDSQIKGLSRRVDSLEKKLTKKTAGKAEAKKTGFPARPDRVVCFPIIRQF